ncbi:helix-turn-helix transcriptional regulator [Caulobacter sp. SL161]|uniref:helix-turn-helix domain-containing protein n=1 Tax=Caulobacter sp. SL161 TaxID=2995156 RepID=UPI002273F6F3|nr:helix-turn-helix transcriptional regulator [Caulobacter sp. SL161]MCY1649151.1 helix-turn-helix transcriptional regulator [Caulobacter sp. SL161]
MDPVARTEIQLAAALRRHRKQAGLTQTDLAAAAQMRQATISGLETGAGGTLATLFAVLTALNLELVVRPRRSGGAHDLEDMF